MSEFDPVYDEDGYIVQHLSGAMTHALQVDGTYVFSGLASVVFPDDWTWKPYPGCNLCADEEASGMWSIELGE